MTDMTAGDELVIAGRRFQSRLFLGTGKFPSNRSAGRAIEASGTEMVTVALRRIDPSATEDILDAIPEPVLLLTNTSGPSTPPRRSAWPAWPGPRDSPTGSSWRSRPIPATCCPTRSRPCGPRRSSCREGFTVLPVLPRRPGALQAPGGSRLRHRDAARIVDRIQPGPANPGRSGDHRGAGHGAGGRRRRHRCPQPRRRGHGARRRRGSGQHRHRYRWDPGAWPALSAWRWRPGGPAVGRACRRSSRVAAASSPLTGFLA